METLPSSARAVLASRTTGGSSSTTGRQAPPCGVRSARPRGRAHPDCHLSRQRGDLIVSGDVQGFGGTTTIKYDGVTGLALWGPHFFEGNSSESSLAVAGNGDIVVSSKTNSDMELVATRGRPATSSGRRPSPSPLSSRFQSRSSRPTAGSSRRGAPLRPVDSTGTRSPSNATASPVPSRGVPPAFPAWPTAPRAHQRPRSRAGRQPRRRHEYRGHRRDARHRHRQVRARDRRGPAGTNHLFDALHGAYYPYQVLVDAANNVFAAGTVRSSS